MSQLKNRKGKLPTKKKKIDLDILAPWKSKGAEITISKVTSNITPTYIQIKIRIKEGFHITATMTPHDFGIAITGQGFVPCTATIE
jgi:hypothetical protein